ncbi:MAG: shikimate dehydrogenase [Verrucomicrobiota bacterium]|nr:shikimate dehydrogenase [Verrucomicrobiota bacterium]
MKKYGLIGWPVKHSVSPPMQNAAFQTIGIEEKLYGLIPVKPELLKDTYKNVLIKEYAGWNITVPHKNAMSTLVDKLDISAELSGSVNTVVNSKNGTKGYSTDGYGLEKALEKNFNIKLKGKTFLFIGAGGASKACCTHFAEQGVAKIIIINRTIAKCEEIAKNIKKNAPECLIEYYENPSDEINSNKFSTIDAVIQATSMGLNSNDKIPLSLKYFNRNTVIFDMIYKETPFQKEAKKAGFSVADGRDMLLYQGMKSFSIWTGKPAPEEKMRKALYSALL